MAAQADHGQKQVTSGRTDRRSLTKGPITEADILVCQASPMNEPDLNLCGLSVRVNNREFPDASDYGDLNRLNGFVEGTAGETGRGRSA